MTANKIIFFSPAFDILCRVTLTADNNDGRKCRARMSAVRVGSCVAGFTLDIEHCYLRAIHVLIITKFAASNNHQYQPCSCPTTVLYPALLLYTALVLLSSWLCNSPSRFFYQQQTLLQTLTVCRDLIFLFRFYIRLKRYLSWSLFLEFSDLTHTVSDRSSYAVLLPIFQTLLSRKKREILCRRFSFQAVSIALITRRCGP